MSKDNVFDFDEDTKVAATPATALGVQVVGQTATEAPADHPKEGVQNVLDTPLPTQPAGLVEAEVSSDDVSEAGKLPEKFYTQAEFDAQLKAVETRFREQIDSCKKQIEEYKEQSERAKGDAKAYKESRDSAYADQRKKDSFLSRAYAQLGDGSPSKLHELLVNYVKVQLDNEKISVLDDKLKKAEKEGKQKDQDLDERNRLLSDKVNEVNGLRDKVRDLEENLSTAQGELSQKETDLCDAKQALESWSGIGNRMLAAIVPRCLWNKDWFKDYLYKLQDQVFASPPSDVAILVLASLSEFAVMERSPATACFDWRKQLSDIGLVVANYMHQMNVPESEVITRLREFSDALRESPTIQELRIELFIPSLGPGFNSDLVKHLRNGTSVGKIINWGILDSNGPYAKAIVE